MRYNPTISRTFSMKSGSLESLKVSLRWGARAKARQMRRILVWLSPHALAIERVLQWVAFFGVDSKVIASTRSISASLSLSGVPTRASSSRPSRRLWTNRLRHFPTVCMVKLSRVATAVLLDPSAHAKTTRARCASACADLGRRAHRSRVACSSCVNMSLGIGRPLRIVASFIQAST